MILYPICSSSSGNCLCVASSDAIILIDVGVSTKSLLKFLQLAGLDYKKIKGIFITHEHSDHISGLYSATKFLKVPVYSSVKTLKELIFKNAIFKGTKILEIDKKTVNICDFFVSAFRVMHDSVDGIRFKIFDGDKRVGICTDLGIVTKNVFDNLKDMDFVFLEANYDVNMLKNGKYPLVLKRRISSNFGHLSNLNAAHLINLLIEDGVRKFLIGHLSEKNNLPHIALKTIIRYLLEKNKRYMKDYEIGVAQKKTTGKFYYV